MRSLRLLLGTAVVLVVSIFLVLNRSAGDYPLLTVDNQASAAVTLIAVLPAGERELGELAAAGSRRFRVRDDTERRFRAQFADGREWATGPVYFTDGLAVTLVVRDDGIDVQREAAR